MMFKGVCNWQISLEFNKKIYYYTDMFKQTERDYPKQLRDELVRFVTSPANSHLSIEGFDGELVTGVKGRLKKLTSFPQTLAGLVLVEYDVNLGGRGCHSTWETRCINKAITSLYATVKTKPDTDETVAGIVLTREGVIPTYDSSRFELKFETDGLELSMNVKLRASRMGCQRMLASERQDQTYKFTDEKATDLIYAGSQEALGQLKRIAREERLIRLWMSVINRPYKFAT